MKKMQSEPIPPTSFLGPNDYRPIYEVPGHCNTRVYQPGYYLLTGFVHQNPGLLTEGFIRTVAWQGMFSRGLPREGTMDYSWLTQFTNEMRAAVGSHIAVNHILGSKGSWTMIGPRNVADIERLCGLLGTVLPCLERRFLTHVGYFVAIVVHVDVHNRKSVLEYNSNSEETHNYDTCGNDGCKQAPVTRYFTSKETTDGIGKKIGIAAKKKGQSKYNIPKYQFYKLPKYPKSKRDGDNSDGRGDRRDHSTASI